jgi:hypothetical protein
MRCTLLVCKFCGATLVSIFYYLKEIEHTSQWVGWLKGCECRETFPTAIVVAKPKPVRGEGKSSQSCQAIEYEKGQSSHASGVAGDDAGGEIFSDDEDEVLQ